MTAITLSRKIGLKFSSSNYGLSQLLSKKRFLMLFAIFITLFCLMALRLTQSGDYIKDNYTLQIGLKQLVLRPTDVSTDGETMPLPTVPSGEVENKLDKFHFPKTKRHLPQCIIIGARKGGTRALLEFLNLHPQIQKVGEEIHFFDEDKKYSMGLEWYRKHMPYTFPDQITMEKSPAYFVTPSVPERIHAMNNSVKLLLIVREPVTRVISDYTQIYANKKIKGKEHDSIESLTILKNGDVNYQYKAIQISIYANYLQIWYDVFPHRQIHIVDGEKLIVNPLPELRRIETFLGLEHKIMPENLFFNETKGFYCLRNDTIEKCLGETKGRKHADVPDRVLHKLRQFFVPHNHRFYHMVGRHMGWPEE